METTVYLIRHAMPLKGLNLRKDAWQYGDDKTPLSVEGEDQGRRLSELDYLSNIDAVYSSDYVTSYATAKYIAFQNQLNLVLSRSFGERIVGVDFDEQFIDHQWSDFNFKHDKGESLNDVRKRMLNGVMALVQAHQGGRIAIVSHSTALCALFTVWCNYMFRLEDGVNTLKFMYHGELINAINKTDEVPVVFELTFDEMELKNFKLLESVE